MLKLKTLDMTKEFEFIPESEEDSDLQTHVVATPLSIGERNDLIRVMLVGSADSTKTLRKMFRAHIKKLTNVEDEAGNVADVTDPNIIWKVLCDPYNASFYGGVIEGLLDASGLTEIEKKS